MRNVLTVICLSVGCNLQDKKFLFVINLFALFQTAFSQEITNTAGLRPLYMTIMG